MDDRVCKVSLRKTNDREETRDNQRTTHLAEKQILIDREIARSQQENTLLKKLLHPVFLESGLWLGTLIGMAGMRTEGSREPRRPHPASPTGR